VPDAGDAPELSGAPGLSDGPGLSDAAVFEANRDLMFAVAYRVLGTITDAEDAVQDAWLRWSAAHREHVADQRAYLARVVVNTALNRLRAVRARREAYVGPWLPEPLLTEVGPDPADRAELAESVSMAMLVVLESLTPDERAVFVLREVFGFSHAEIGATLGRPDAAVRQLAHRAREHVQARRPRFDVDWNQQREVTERFLAAAAGGDIEGLVSVLADDVTLLTDGGGKAKAPLRPITGAGKVARFMAGVARRPYMGVAVSAMSVDAAEINGVPGTLISWGGQPVAVLTMAVADGRVTAIQLLTNPDKLSAVASGRTLPR
jgi:RNA polymerase sigma-70 factor (ECF subfamily)